MSMQAPASSISESTVTACQISYRGSPASAYNSARPVKLSTDITVIFFNISMRVMVDTIHNPGKRRSAGA